MHPSFTALTSASLQNEIKVMTLADRPAGADEALSSMIAVLDELQELIFGCCELQAAA